VSRDHEHITDLDSCDLSERWGLELRFSAKLLLAAKDFEAETRRAVEITSGSRTRAEQEALRRSGRPAARDEVSTHRSCPATGADISLGFLPVRVHKQIWGRILFMNGLRSNKVGDGPGQFTPANLLYIPTDPGLPIPNRNLSGPGRVDVVDIDRGVRYSSRNVR